MARADIVQNPAEGTTELWLDGKFVAGWNEFEYPSGIKGVLEAMLQTAYKEGQRVGEGPLREKIQRALTRG